MSAIAGVFSRHGEARNPNEVSPMLAVMARRGPDATGDWARGEVALGHGALHSTPSAVSSRSRWSILEAAMSSLRMFGSTTGSS